MPKLIERRQDYVFRIDSLAAGATMKGQIQIQTSAPFALRSLGMTSEAGDMQLVSMRWADETGEWVQNRPVFLGGQNTGQGNTSGYLPLAGLRGMPTPVYPQIIYPAEGGVIQIEVTNNDVATITNGKIYFSGVSLFEEGAVWSPAHPECYLERTYDYAFDFTVTATQTRLNLPLQFENDGDFAFRGGTIAAHQGTVARDEYINLYARLRDQEGNYFQADWVHVDFLFSTLPERPTIWYPEIYIPRNGQLFIDLMRNDVAALTSITQFNLQGAKVFNNG